MTQPKHETVITMAMIEEYATDYADARDTVAGVVQNLQDDLEEVRRKYMPALKTAVGKSAEHHAQLKHAIGARPDLFEKPKTQVIAGIRIGYRKEKGKVEIDDEEAVIKRIRKLLPEEQAELLIRTRESVDKNAVGDLSVQDLKRLGIAITDDEEMVFIKPTDGAVDKLVKKLLADAEEAQEA